MDRIFMVRSGQTGACYCGKCGKRQLADRYNMHKHAMICGSGIGEKDEIPLIDEDSSWGYCLDALPITARACDQAAAITAAAITARACDRQALRLRVCAPRLRKVRGFTDRFSGLEWVPVFEAVFPAGSKSPEIEKNMTGYPMDVLLSLIRAGRIVPIRTKSDAEIVRRVFPCIDVYSLQMFVHIYKNKGYSAAERIRSGTETLLFERVPDSDEWSRLCAGSGRTQARAAGAKGAAQSGTAAGTALTVRGGEQAAGAPIPIRAALYRYRGESYILQVVLKREERQTVFLFTRGYCSCSEQAELRELLGQQYCLTGNSMNAVTQFDKTYPEYHLAAYAARSHNILIPLLAADFHSGMELAAKSGATAIAECYDRLTVFEKMPGLYRNLRDLFGVPVSVLRTLDREQVCDAVMERLREIYAYSPVFLQFETYTPSMMEFYMRADITRSGMRGIEGIDALNDKQILQILRYLEKHPDDGQYYCDYMNACAQLGEYPYGITPNVPIREAHDRTVARVRNYHDIKTRMTFEEVVHGGEYLKLVTCLTDEDEEAFEKDPFIVTAPNVSDDLFRESESMHNCVRIYVKGVTERRTRIYFLRRKEEPEKSFGTLEVSGDGKRLRQAKAFGNKRLGIRAQKFLVKWCRRKGVSIDTWDVSSVPYST